MGQAYFVVNAELYRKKLEDDFKVSACRESNRNTFMLFNIYHVLTSVIGGKSIDLDGNGYVDRSELRKYVNSTGFNVSENELDDLMKGIDDNEDGKISLEEFIASSVSRKLEKKED